MHMKYKVFAFIIAIILTAAALGGCSNAGNEGGQTATDSPAGQTAEPSGPMGSAEATDVRVGLILGPPSMGLGWMMEQAANGNTFNRYAFTVDGIDYTKLAAELNQGKYDIITAPSNVSAILYNNKDMKEKVKVISINNMGVLFILTTDPGIREMNDLKGRTVYSIGEGGPPEYTFDYLLNESGLSEDVNFSFRATPFEVLNLLLDEKNAVALLPQPFVEVAKLLVPDIFVPIDITEAWDALNLESGAEAVTTVSVVRTAFLEQHEQAVIEYLKLAKQSTDYTLAHVEEAAAWTDKYQTFLNPEVAVDAIPQISLGTITGEDLKQKLSGFLQIMYDMNPAVVGGAMPGDDFYYMPPGD